jgi:hypothetical protein
MKTLAIDPITPRHPRWEEFLDRLEGPDGCAVTQLGWICFNDHRFSRRILAGMGLHEPAILASLAYFRDHGGYCDCEVLMNVGG